MAIILGGAIRSVPWKEARHALKGSLFLLCLVTSASMMPVNELPPASVPTTFGLGFFSAVFDNIPLTKLALDQGGYDWGMLAFAVGFGGSMIWFGSSAGVAVTNEFEEAKTRVAGSGKAGTSSSPIYWASGLCAWFWTGAPEPMP